MSAATKKHMQHLIEVARPAILEIASQRSCILSTGLAVDYLRRHKIQARPLAVSLLAYSPAYMEKVRQLGSMPDQETARCWFAESEMIWVLGVGVPGQPASSGKAGWEGHLVAIVEERYLLDLSADQASRPGKNMLVEPFFYQLGEGKSDFLTGGALPLLSEQGAMLLYSSRPKDRSYEQAGDWRKRNWLPLLNRLQ